jgi:alpha-2-macroglobulin
VHIAVTLEKWDSVTHERTETAVTSKRCATGADGTVLVDLPIMGNGSGDFEVTPARRRRRTAPSKADLGLDLERRGRVVQQPNTQAQIVADKKTYQVGDTAHLLLVTGLPNRGPW